MQCPGSDVFPFLIGGGGGREKEGRLPEPEVKGRLKGGELAAVRAENGARLVLDDPATVRHSLLLGLELASGLETESGE